MDSTAFLIIAILAIAVQSFWLFLALFEPPLPYTISSQSSIPLESQDLLRLLEVLVDTRVSCQNRIEVLTNGEIFYEAELEAIRAAQHSINLESYIFQKGHLTRRFLEALSERARSGVRVNLVLDAVGSFATWASYLAPLRAAGGRVVWYHPLRWYSWPRLNNRTHRNLLVIDGGVGFLSGAGFADHWLLANSKSARWRDTMVRVEGDVVSSIQGMFAEHWLEASGEILMGTDYFPFPEGDARTFAAVVNSSVSAGGATRARLLFQVLIASARTSIHITMPYFLPDKSLRDELIRAVKERGVSVKIITAGQRNDHLLTRHSSRRLYGELLKAGAEIYEYRPAMIHTKCMIIDGVWVTVGSTNMDFRSFYLNDEVNLVALNGALARRLNEDFVQDLAQSQAMSYNAWRGRPLRERLHEWLGWILERQQ